MLNFIVNELKFVPFERYKKRQIDLTVAEEVLAQNWKYKENKRK